MVRGVRTGYSLLSRPELRWAVLCAILTMYYICFTKVNSIPTIKIFTGNNPKYHNALGSKVKYIDNNVDIDIETVLFSREKKSAPSRTVVKPPKIINGYPRPEIEFINRKRDKLAGEKPNTIRILSWTAKYNEEMEWFTEKQAESCDLGPDATCEYTSDKSMYNYSDALLIRLRLIPEYKLPTYRFSSQKWVYVEFESSVYAQRPWFEANTDIFNLTNTPSPQTDIRYPRPRVIKKKNPSNTTKDYAKDKPHMAAWFVSNCHTQSRRELYAEELAKYIPVDVYGTCGNKTCTKLKSDCEHMLLDYKFYLSFENSLCRDYFTEKFWRTMTKPIVGVVLGAADYSKYVPAGTYIDIRDFPSPKALADHLLHLDQHDEEYNAIIHKKEQYVVDWQNEQRHVCDICRYVRDHMGITQTVADAHLLYNQEKNCQTPKDFYKQSAPSLNVPGIFFN